MRKFFKGLIIIFFTLLLIAKATKGINFADDYLVLFWSALSLSVLNIVIKPILNLLLMPINLLTLGASRWIVNVLVLLLVMLINGSFRVVGFTTVGFSFSGLIVPSIHLSFIWSLILVSFLIEFVSLALNWIFE